LFGSLLFPQLHEVVEPERVGEAIDGVELAGDEDTLENLVVPQSRRAKRTDVLSRDLVRVLGGLQTEAEKRLVLPFDRQGIDVRGFGRLCCLLAASYRPQEK